MNLEIELPKGITEEHARAALMQKLGVTPEQIVEEAIKDSVVGAKVGPALVPMFAGKNPSDTAQSARP